MFSMLTNDERPWRSPCTGTTDTQGKGGIELRNYVIATAVVVACSGLVGVAQSPSATPQTPPAQQTQPQSATAQASTTLTGCVYREKDIPGRAPNVAERAGVLEDYILADVKPAAVGTSGTVGTSGAASHAMYKLELIGDEKLKAAVGKRVEVTGRIDAEAGDSKSAAAPPASQTDKAVGHDKVDLAEFEVTSMREVPGSCPATPAEK
jgi:hypothetical protein